MTRRSTTACTGGEGAGHPTAAHAPGVKGKLHPPESSAATDGAAAAARMATVWVVGDTARKTAPCWRPSLRERFSDN